MKQNVPTAVAVIVVVLAIVIAIVVIWRKAGEKPIVGFPEKPVGMKMKPMPPGQPPAPAPTAPPGETK